MMKTEIKDVRNETKYKHHWLKLVIMMRQFK